MWHRLLLGAGMVVKEGPLPVSMGLTDMGGSRAEVVIIAIGDSERGWGKTKRDTTK